MANIGRQYRRLFERDFGFRGDFGFKYLPKRMRQDTGLGLGSNCIRYKNTPTASAPGIADYNAGIVTYNFTSPLYFHPDAFIRLEWHLTDTATFGIWHTYFGRAGVDWYEVPSDPPGFGFPFVSQTITINWLISPIPNCIPQVFGFNSWDWDDGPPDD